MSTNSDGGREKAEEARAKGESMLDAQAKETLARVAKQYEAMATRAEQQVLLIPAMFSIHRHQATTTISRS